MFTEINITNVNCPVKEKNQQKTIWTIFLIFPEKCVLQFMQTISFSLEDSLHEMSNPVLSNYVF